MSLKSYNKKRDFKVTAEPAGKVARSRTGSRFFIQKHAASHLHFDFRLEFAGVLKSWAVPKGPSVFTGVRRLAMEVEDHPLDYGDFEGTIPRGEYGGGTVMLWDRGTWEPVGDPKKGFSSGKITFQLKGRRLRGVWSLIRTGMGGNENAWFLIKKRESERKDPQIEVTESEQTSVKSKRTMDAIAAGRKIWRSNRTKEAA
jgi:bifunctional non-homologous end joining protein LigD